LTLREVLNQAQTALEARSIEDARLEAEVLLRHVLDLTRTGLYSDFYRTLTEAQLAEFWRLLKRRFAGEPVAYITGHREFYGLDFTVTPDVLIPRPETEVLVEQAISLAGNRALSIADIGTGCGAIAISLAVKLLAARIFATDISPAALEVARRNCERHRVADRVTLVLGDLLEPLPGPVDMIVANLPYVRTAELPLVNTSGFEPRLALDGGVGGLDQIRRLCAAVPRYLNAGGALLLEIGLGQRDTVAAAVATALARYLPAAGVAFAADLAGIDRVAIATPIRSSASP
jgi:release factor glutamine methyltransferase